MVLAGLYIAQILYQSPQKTAPKKVLDFATI